MNKETANRKDNIVDLSNEKDQIQTTIPDEDIHQSNYTIIPNEIFDHPDISPYGKLLMWYLLKHAGIANWIYRDSAMQKFLKCGRDKLEAAFKTLRQTGYVTNVVIRDQKGRAVGSKRIFSNTPKFLEINKPKLKVIPSTVETVSRTKLIEKSPKSHSQRGLNRSPENQGPINQGPGKPGLIKRKEQYKERQLQKKNNNKTSRTKPTNTNPGTSVVDDPVVASLVKKLNGSGMHTPKQTVKNWLNKYDAEHIETNLAYMLAQCAAGKEIKKPLAYLTSAIERNYAASEQTASQNSALSKYIEPAYPSHNENVAWFKLLTVDEKSKLLEKALHKQYTFEQHLEYQKTSVMDADFTNHSLFKILMSLVGRGN